jgi:hypothetical protein
VLTEDRALNNSHCPPVVAMAKRLRRANPVTGKRWSFRKIAKKLEEAGYLNERRAAFHPESVRAMVEGPTPAKVWR